tara:strand:+ start:7238 stop:7696 length:459 start_codon:yes stop_codon:yes gene_type:complete
MGLIEKFVRDTQNGFIETSNKAAAEAAEVMKEAGDIAATQKANNEEAIQEMDETLAAHEEDRQQKLEDFTAAANARVADLTENPDGPLNSLVELTARHQSDQDTANATAAVATKEKAENAANLIGDLVGAGGVDGAIAEINTILENLEGGLS